MKKLLLLCITAVMMAGCGLNETNVPSERTAIKIGGWTGYVYEVDSCEYIIFGHGFTHKGNCKFCKERREKEIREIINEFKK